MIRVEFEASSEHAFSRDERVAIRRICDAVDIDVRRHLPALPASVRLSVRAGRYVIPEMGEVGCALSPDHVSWTVDATRSEGVVEIARRHLRATLYHELHHVVRGWTAKAPRTSFMHGVVSEGLATVFERAGGRDAPWGHYPAHVSAWVAELLALPDDSSYESWMFQHPDGRRWIGYRAG